MCDPRFGNGVFENVVRVNIFVFIFSNTIGHAYGYCKCLEFSVVAMPEKVYTKFSNHIFIYQWPPKVLRDLYNNPEFIKDNHNECNSSFAIIQEFELTKDLKNIPDSKEIKCYLYRAYVHYGYIKPNSPKLNFQPFLELMSETTDDDAKRMAKLFAGCEKRARKSKDPVEVVYIFNACGKQNVNDVSSGGKRLANGIEV